MNILPAVSLAEPEVYVLEVAHTYLRSEDFQRQEYIYKGEYRFARE